MAKVKYIKLGEKAASFHDPYSGLVLSGKEVKKISNTQSRSQKVKKALLGGHLSIADKVEYDEWVEFEASTRKGPEAKAILDTKALKDGNVALKDENAALKTKIEKLEAAVLPEKSEFDNMTNNALEKYYEENYEVSKDEGKEFEEFDLDEKRTFLKALVVDE